MAIKITQEHRNAIYRELLVDLTGTGEIYTHIQNGDYEDAQETRRRYEEDMRLLDDLGWDPHRDDEEYEITMDSDDLARALPTPSVARSRDLSWLEAGTRARWMDGSRSFGYHLCRVRSSYRIEGLRE